MRDENNTQLNKTTAHQSTIMGKEFCARDQSSLEVTSVNDLRKVNYSMRHAKNLVMSKNVINDSLEVARKNIYYMSLMKSKNDVLTSSLSKTLDKDKTKR